MRTFEVKVKNLIWGYYAPSIYVDAIDPKDAIPAAKKKSRLSDFPQWAFIPYEK